MWDCASHGRVAWMLTDPTDRARTEVVPCMPGQANTPSVLGPALKSSAHNSELANVLFLHQNIALMLQLLPGVFTLPILAFTFHLASLCVCLNLSLCLCLCLHVCLCLCLSLTSANHTHTHTNTRTRTHAHARTHARTHAHTHKHTHTDTLTDRQARRHTGLADASGA